MPFLGQTGISLTLEYSIDVVFCFTMPYKEQVQLARWRLARVHGVEDVHWPSKSRYVTSGLSKDQRAPGVTQFVSGVESFRPLANMICMKGRPEASLPRVPRGHWTCSALIRMRFYRNDRKLKAAPSALLLCARQTLRQPCCIE